MLGLDIAYMHAKFNHSCFSHSKDVVGADHNLNGSLDLPRPIEGWFAIRGLALATISISTKLEVSISTHYKDMNGTQNI